MFAGISFEQKPKLIVWLSNQDSNSYQVDKLQ